MNMNNILYILVSNDSQAKSPSGFTMISSALEFSSSSSVMFIPTGTEIRHYMNVFINISIGNSVFFAL